MKKITLWSLLLCLPMAINAQDFSSSEQQEIDANALRQSQVTQTEDAANSGTSIYTPNSSMADFIPTAGATETFSPAAGDLFFDPGGPGGSSTGGDTGNYPNCGCVTTTTLDGVTEVEFTFFSVFANWDWLRIYDSADTSGTVLYDNGAGGANEGDTFLADMIASHGSAIFTGSSGALTFEFNASAVVDYGGWEVEVLGGGSGGCTVDSFPFNETFEDDSTSRDCWTQIQEQNTGDWTYATGSSGGTVLTANSGTLNARFVSVNPVGNPHITKLVSPVMDLSNMVDNEITFSYAQEDWLGDQNETKVYYRVSDADPWVEIAHYTGSVAAWTQETLALPNPSATYQIAFEGINNWGRANVIDDVIVDGTEVVACDAIATFPFTETFEDDSASRDCWTQIQEQNTGDWTYATGSSGGTVLTANGGTLNARFVSVNPVGNPHITKLVSPVMDLSGASSAEVTFSYAQEDWLGDQNETKVYYRVSDADPWVEIAHYTANVAAWTQETLDLPNPSATYQIAFEGINNWGRANVIDDVTVDVVGGGGGNEWVVTVEGTTWGDEISWELRDADDNILLSVAEGTYGNGFFDEQSVNTDNEPLEFYIETMGAFGDNEPTYTITCSGNLVVTGTLAGGSEATESDLVCDGGGDPIEGTCDLVSSTPDDTTSDDVWDRPFADGTCCSGAGPVSYHIYGAFTVTEAGTYDFSSIQDGWDGYLLLYETAFDPMDQTANFVIGNDDGAGGIGTSDFSVALATDTEYFLITTGFGAGDFGNFTNTITGPGDVLCGDMPVEGELAYGINNATGELVTFDPADPSVLTVVGTSPVTDFENAGAIDPMNTDMAYVLDNVNNFFSVDLTTGTYTSEGTIVAPNGGAWVGISFDPTDGTLYGISSIINSFADLCIIDLGAQTATAIGTTGMLGAIDVAVDSDGNIYSYDIVDDSFYSIDPDTGVATLVGPLGYDANFGQGMTWDPNHEIMYLSAFNNGTFQGELRTVDLATGATTLVGALGDGSATVQMAWMSIPLDGDIIGTNEDMLSAFVFYPNPASDIVTLSSDRMIESVTIFNISGQKVLSQEIGATTSQLNISNLATGAYLLQVVSEGQTGTYQLMKK